MRRILAGWIGTLLLASSYGCGDGGAESPNLLLVTIDTLRADHVSAYGYERQTTPAIDRLAAEGVRFRHAIVQRAETWPSLTSILTSTYPHTHGVRSNGDVVDAPQATLAELLGAAGFTTAAFLTNMTTAPHPGFTHTKRWGVEQWVESGHSGVDRQAVAAARDWMAAHAGERFFVWVHLIGPHDPYEPPPDRPRRFATGYEGDLDGSKPALMHVRTRRRSLEAAELAHIVSLYDDEVALVDENVGRLLDALDAQDLADRTLVALIGDHGEELYDHGAYFFHTWSIHGSVLRVPLVLRWPGRLPAGREVDAVVESVDLAPTLLPLLGVDAPASFEGADLAPRIARSDGDAQAAAFSELGPAIHALRTGRWHYVYNPEGYSSPGGRDRDSGHRGYFRMVGEQLYDLEADPREQRNLADERPELALRLRQRLLDRARPAGTPRTGEMAPETAAELRALGYLEDEIAIEEDP